MDKLGGLGTLGRPARRERGRLAGEALDLSTKLQAGQLPAQFHSLNCRSAELEPYDKMSVEQLGWFLHAGEVPLPPLPPGPLAVLLCGDSTLASLAPASTFPRLDRQCGAGLRSYTGHFSPGLGAVQTALALGDRRLAPRARALLPAGPIHLVGLCLGGCPARERRDPAQAAAAIGQLWEQFQAEGLVCFIMALVPVLAEEARGEAYSACWSSRVNHQVARDCQEHGRPFLPLDRHMFRRTGAGGLGAAPNRGLVTVKGELGEQGRLLLAGDIVRFVNAAHKPEEEPCGGTKQG
jgi:hypothetical protein